MVSFKGFIIDLFFYGEILCAIGIFVGFIIMEINLVFLFAFGMIFCFMFMGIFAIIFGDLSQEELGLLGEFLQMFE